MSLSPEEKARIIKALEEDKKFRYALMGLLGYKEILDRITKLEEKLARLEEESRETRRVLTVIAHRFGVLTESGFREAMKYVLQDIFGVAKVERVTIYDEKGIVYGHSAVIDIDVVVRDKEHILIEIK